MSKREAYLSEHDEWLKSNADLYKTWNDVADAFNNQFNANRKATNLKRHCNILGLRKSYHSYSDVEVQWLKDNIDKYPVEELLKRFNKEFSVNLTYDGFLSFRYRCARGIIKKDKGKFMKKVSVGEERVHGKYIYVKTKETDEKMDGDWRKLSCELKQHIVWKEHYGEIPEGHQIVFLNNNTHDCRIENLYCIPKKFLPYMMHNKWFSDNPEVTLTAIKWCELMYATRK